MSSSMLRRINRALFPQKECDTCGALLSGMFYHCSSCGTGDYDLCSPCLEAGKHCEDIDHLLVELVISCGYPVAKKYFSSVKSSGLREVTVVSRVWVSSVSEVSLSTERARRPGNCQQHN
jgi:hypothetical protein